jgi:hypothetical protein
MILDRSGHGAPVTQLPDGTYAIIKLRITSAAFHRY